MTAPLLRLEAITVWRERTPVLRDIRLSLEDGGRLALLGDNGAGKSSLLMAIAGHLRTEGPMVFADSDIGGLPAHRRARLGIGYSPEGRRVFPAMSVVDNLLVAAHDGDATDLAEQMFSLFPELGRRRAAPAWQLSGGEQQMLALGRALMGRPRLLLLDEPFLGLAPQASERLTAALNEIAKSGVSLLLADQVRERAQSLCERSIFVDRGVLRG